ncbi:MFS transporter [Streptomyces sp. DSM 42041]|uniref:MFS transporter n=1 Tax=Streptomyces hazeniae TaxID=3075538 RepID=A0ABU2P2F9_9ACTN|nr:MFS transporter [Streptomyces sp. DSM 42041]MDT0382098.1 MFS transporter [Streptomyces sp. DSM 42041]
MGRIAAACFAGTAIEYYDFSVYGVAAALVFGPLFFPTFSPTAGLLAAFGAFAAGFLARPLGSVLFGHVGDRFGRRTVLLGSLLTTGLATVGVGLLPGYDTLGVAAPALLVLLRFVQGLGVGGEWTGAVLLASEHAPPHRRGLWAGFPQVGPAVGYLLANGLMLAMSAGLSEEAFLAWGWRVPFWAAGVLMVAGYALRHGLGETPEFRRVAAEGRAAAPFAEVVRGHGRRVLLVAGATAGAYALYYGVVAWSLAHATGPLGMDPTTMLACLMAAVAVMGLATPVAAALGDRFGRRRMSLAGYAAMVVCIVPYLLLLRTGEPVWIAAGAAVTLLALVVMLGVQGAYLPELFAARVRCTGTAVSYNLGAVLGGAVAPLAATRIAASAGAGTAEWAVGGYLAVVCAASLLCVLRLPDTRQPRRNEEAVALK